MSDFYSAQTMNTMIYEILNHANELLKQDREKGIQYLQNNRSRTVIEGLLKFNYDPSVSFRIPPGEAPYKKNKDVPDGYCLTDLKQEFRRLRIFLDADLNIQNVRREQLWIQMCEGLYWKEAELIHKIKDRRIADMYDALTAETVKEAYPDLLPDVVAEPVPVEAVSPVDYGPDPSNVSEEELIKEAVEQYIKEELPVLEKDVSVDSEYAEFLAWKAEQAKKATVGVKQGQTISANNGTQPQEPRIKKKPGRKPKSQVS